MSEPIFMWEDEFYPLSNFSAFAVEWQGKLWPTCEHAYQAASFLDEEIKQLILEARSAHDSRVIAHQHKSKRRADWNEVKEQVMEELFRAKIAQHEYAREKLLASGDREIVKNVPDDSFWGWGADHKGENRMGKLWMRIRNELRKA
jgi:ribA/ribD-fused uncharacterized protein